MGWELHRFPASAFGVVLGTAGQANLWHAMCKLNVTGGPLKTVAGAPVALYATFWMLALVLMSVATLIYAAKFILRWRAVKWEFSSSIHINFFFMPLLVVLVLGMTAPTPPFAEYHFHYAVLYIVVLILLVLEIHLYMEWMYGVSRSLAWANPTYQLAMVGNIIASGTASVVGDHTLAVFLFAVGIFYFVIMLAALHVVRDTRSWLALNASEHKSAAAVTSRARSQPGRHHPSLVLSHTSCDSRTPIVAHDELGNRRYMAVQLRSTRDNTGVVVYDPNAASPDPSIHSSASNDTQDSILVASPEPPSMSLNLNAESDSDSVLLTPDENLQDQMDFMAVSEVFTEQFLPHKVNVWSLPAMLQPTLFLYVAPPSLATTSWLLLQGHDLGEGKCDDVCKSFASLGILFFLFMLGNLPRFILRSPFSFAFWAFTFPSSALAVAVTEFGTASGSVFLQGLAVALVFLSSLTWLVVSACTLLIPALQGIDVLLLPKSVPH